MMKNLILPILFASILFICLTTIEAKTKFTAEQKKVYKACGKSYDCIYNTCVKRRFTRFKYSCDYHASEWLLAHFGKNRKKEYLKCKDNKECAKKICQKTCPKGRMCAFNCRQEADLAARQYKNKVRDAAYARCNYKEKCLVRACVKSGPSKTWCEYQAKKIRYHKNKSWVNLKKLYKQCKGDDVCYRLVCGITCPIKFSFKCRSKCSKKSEEYAIKHEKDEQRKLYKGCHFKYGCIHRKCMKGCKEGKDECPYHCQFEALQFIRHFKPKKISSKKEYAKCKLDYYCLENVCSALCSGNKCYRCSDKATNFIVKGVRSDKEKGYRLCAGNRDCYMKVCLSGCSGRWCYRSCNRASNHYRYNYGY